MVSNNVEYEGVPTTTDLENNSNQTKYTVNKPPPKGHIVISKTACALMTLGVLFLLILAVVATIFIIPLVQGDRENDKNENSLQKADILSSFTAGTSSEQSNEPVAPHLRLPRSIKPTIYDLQILPLLDEGNFTTTGTVKISLLVTDDTRKIIFNAMDLNIEKESLKVNRMSDNKDIPVAQQDFNYKTQRYTVTMDEDLVKDEKYVLTIQFKGYLKDNMQGFYRSSYLNKKTNQTRWLASTQFSPTSARRAFPCFDEPSFKAKFKISIGRPINMTTLSNSLIKNEEPVQGRPGWVWDHYDETPLMSTYIVGFIMSDLQKFTTTKTNDKPTISLWSRPDAISETNYVSTIVPSLLKFFERKFEIDFPLPKIDMVAVPDFGFQAMENWGLITFRESVLLYDPLYSTIADKLNTAKVVAHEIVHQWFGNLVTPEWWDNLWVKEGFADYFAYAGVNAVEPSWTILEEFPMLTMYDAFEIDWFQSSRALYFPIKNSDQIIQAFDPISYSKGASIIRMAHYALGDDIFNKAMVKYLQTHIHANADHNDVWNAFDLQIEEEVGSGSNITTREIFNTWIEQPGFPLVSASYNAKEENLTLKQTRFYMNLEHISNSAWYIPISCATADSPNFTDTKPKWWFEGKHEQHFPLKTKSWYLLNLQQTGYFIVNYDEDNWRALTENFISLPPTIRGQLVWDAFSLAQAGIIDYDFPLRMAILIGTKDREINYIPLYTVLYKLEFLKNMLQNTPIYGDFEKFIKSVFSYSFERITLDEKPTDNYRQQQIRRTVLHWTLRMGDYGVVVDARQLFRNWMSDGTRILPNLRYDVYCAAIREGEEAEWNFAMSEYLKTTVPAEKTMLLTALGCTKKTWMLSKYLNMLLEENSGVRKHDGVRLFHSVAHNPVGHQLAFDFMRNRWSDLKARYGDGFNMISKMVNSLSTLMNTEYQLNQLIAFRDANKDDLGASSQAFDRTIQKITLNIVWMKKNYKSIEEWLQETNRVYRW